MPRPDIKNIKELVDGEELKLLSLTNKLIEQLPLFKDVGGTGVRKLSSVDDVRAVGTDERKYLHNIKGAIWAAELRERVASKERGQTINASAESAAGGEAARAKYADIEKRMKTRHLYYTNHVNERVYKIIKNENGTLDLDDDESASAIAFNAWLDGGTYVKCLHVFS